MVDSDALFDMRTATSSLLPFPMPFLLLAMAIVPIFGLTRPQLARGGDPQVNRAGYLIFLLLILAAFAAACVPLALGQWARVVVADGKTRTVQGCVTDFQREVHPNAHNIADTYFSLGGSEFHFNSSPWLPGFHNEDNVVRQGQGLRIVMSGQTVMRIESDPQKCAQGAG